MTRPLTIYRPGMVGYEEALAFQRGQVDRLARSRADEGVLVLLQHAPVITIGRSGSARNILAPAEDVARHGVAVIETNRGGDVTYHGPGQIVGYPILPLAFHGRDVHAYLRRLEAVLMAALRDYGIAADRKPGYTGVWTPAGKIASIGIAISKWISYHGFALNVDPNMDHFALIRPCGLSGISVASMAGVLGSAPEIEEVADRLTEHFCAEFHFDERRVEETT